MQPLTHADQQRQPDKLLLITDRTSPSNRYGPYVGEILRSEGLLTYQMEDLASVNEKLLAESCVAILTRCTITPKERDLLSNYVTEGGQLILIAPQFIWQTAIGLLPLPSAILDGYVKLAIREPFSRGLPAESFQFHGISQKWTLNGATALASLYSGPAGATACAAIALHQLGKGRVITFTYDVGECVAGIRQGNPRLASSKLDDTNFSIRAGDLFGAGWLDPTKEHIPQADIHQAMLARAIEVLSPIPLPRLWYLPGMARSILLLTGDGEVAPPEDFQAEIDSVERFGGHVTIYLKEDCKISPEQEAAWRERGHDFGLHPWAGPDATIQLQRQEWARMENWFRARYGHPSRTIRSHWLQWCGYTDTARVLADIGVPMDTNYVSTPPSHGKYMVGSGRAMRFVTEAGEILPVWQQPTHLEDDVLLRVDSGYKYNPISINLSTDEGVSLCTELLTSSAEHYHTPIMMNLHPPFYPRFAGAWLDRTLEFAHAKGIPLWNAKQWMDFVAARDAVQLKITGYDWKQNKLSFCLPAADGSADLTLCVPDYHEGKRISQIKRAGTPVERTSMTIQDKNYAVIPITNGELSFEVFYEPEA